MNAVHREQREDGVVQRQDGGFGRVHGAALILLGAATVLAPPAMSRYGFGGFVTTYAVALVAWLPLRERSLPLRATFLIAIGLRTMLLFAEPALSGDVYRYVWDGKVSAHGINPYAYAPDDAHLAELREPWHGRINHPEIATIYPPLAEWLFRMVHDLTAWRLLLVIADVAVIALLPRYAALAYATFPPLLIEGAWNGHIDALAGALVVLALVRASSLALALAGGLKIIPLAATPALVRRPFVFAFALVAPVLSFLGGPIMPGFREYAARWIFNSPLYDIVLAIASRVPTKEIWTHHPLRFAAISDFVYRHVYPDCITRAILGSIAVVLILAARKHATRAIGILILFSPAIHPWYWLALAGAAIVEREQAWLFVALCAPFSYLLYDRVAPLLVFALCYAAPLVMMFPPSAIASSASGWTRAALRSRTARRTSPM